MHPESCLWGPLIDNDHFLIYFTLLYFKNVPRRVGNRAGNSDQSATSFLTGTAQGDKEPATEWKRPSHSVPASPGALLGCGVTRKGSRCQQGTHSGGTPAGVPRYYRTRGQV